MALTPQLLTRKEAAELSGLPLNAVNKAVEQRVVRPRRRKGRTFLAVEDALALALFRELPPGLPIAVKRRLRDWAVDVSGDDGADKECQLSPAMRVALTEDLLDTFGRATRYVRLRDEYVETNPNVMGGVPVIRGTRMPVRTLAQLIEGGESLEALREDYPHIPNEAYDVAVLWTRANPRRGRPVSTDTSAGA